MTWRMLSQWWPVSSHLLYDVLKISQKELEGLLESTAATAEQPSDRMFQMSPFFHLLQSCLRDYSYMVTPVIDCGCEDSQ